MKVRRKGDPQSGEYEVREETTHSYHTVEGSVLNKDYFEPVSDTLQWENVSEECAAYADYKDQIYTATGPSGIPLSHTVPGSYRLRKVRVREIEHSAIGRGTGPESWAFIVERRVW